jgi:hypothetical protein
MQNFIETLINVVQTWTKKKIKESTADWNEGDSNSNSYIKNKPFYESEEKVKLVPKTTVSIPDDERYEKLGYFTQLEAGKTYYVTLNGVEYECVARNVPDSGYVLIGNGTVYGDGNEGNGEPFSCDSYPDGNIFLNVKDAGDYTISILEPETVVHKLDAKYLSIIENVPETVVSLENVRDTDVYEGPEYKKLVGCYKVYIDDQPKILEFVDHGDYSDIVEDNSYNIETRNGGIYFAFWDDLTANPHDVKIVSIDTYDEKINKKYLPEDIGGAQLQADWNQSDENGPDYIKNRTHYEQVNSEVVADEIAEYNAYENSFEVNLSFPPVEYHKYIITLGNTTLYTGVVGNNGDEYYAYIYRTEAEAEEDDYNLSIGQLYGWNDTRFYVYDLSLLSDPLHVTVTHIAGVELKQLDEKFIPDSIARADDIVQADWEETDDTQISYIQNKPTNLVTQEEVAKLQAEIIKLQNLITFNGIYLTDISNGGVYCIQMKDGNLITSFSPEATLVDFDYTNNGNTYTLTGWKGTYQGAPSTELVVPNIDKLDIIV